MPRRTFLRGVLGGSIATVALPPLEAMLNTNGTALSSGADLPRRLVCFHFGNGVLLDRWVPATQGAYELTPELAPLLDVKDACHVLSGFQAKAEQALGHHGGFTALWSAYPYISLGGPSSKFGGPTIDQVAVRAMRARTRFPSLQLAVSKRVQTDEGPTLVTMSSRAVDAPLLPETNPVALFERLFNFSSPDDPRVQRRLRVLDAVRGEAQALQARVGAADRARLESHLDSIAQLESQINSLPPACTLPGAPTETNTDVDGREPMTLVAAAMIDLLGYALTCDLTRVVSFMLAPPGGYAVYTELGHTTEFHLMSHRPEEFLEGSHDGIVWNMEQLAALLRRLRVPEGACTLLDQTVVLAGSEVSTPSSHSIDDLPIIVAGGGGGAIRQPGQHLRSATNRSVSDVALTCLKAVAPGIASVGAGALFSETPVTEIMT